jgi:hypothetical protein
MAFGAALLAVLIGTRFVLWPAVSMWRESRTAAMQAQDDFDRLKTSMTRLDHQKRSLSGIFGPAVAGPIESLQLVQVRMAKRIEQSMSQAGVGIANISPQPVERLRELPGMSIVRMRVEGTCRFEQLAQCLAHFAKAEQLILVDRLSAQGVEGKPGELKLSLVLSSLAVEEKP